MTETILSKSFEISGHDLKRMYREKRDFEADRIWDGGTVYFLAHAEGFVMARKYGPKHPIPFVISETTWRTLPPVVDPSPEPR